MKGLSKEDIKRFDMSVELLQKIAKEHFEYYDGECPEFVNGTCDNCGVCEYYNDF